MALEEESMDKSTEEPMDISAVKAAPTTFPGKITEDWDKDVAELKR